MVGRTAHDLVGSQPLDVVRGAVQRLGHRRERVVDELVAVAPTELDDALPLEPGLLLLAVAQRGRRLALMARNGRRGRRCERRETATRLAHLATESLRLSVVVRAHRALPAVRSHDRPWLFIDLVASICNCP